MGKQFKDAINPALDYITKPNRETEIDTPKEAPVKPVPASKTYGYGAEAKSKRVQLLVKPSVYSKIKDKADAEGLSFNELVHRLLEKEI